MVSGIIRNVVIHSLKAETWKVYLWYLLPLLALPIAYFTSIVSSTSAMPVSFLSFMLLSPVGPVAVSWRSAVLCRKLRSGYYRFCPGCGHCLGASLDSGNCPGCGQEFELSDVRRIWRNRFGDCPPCSEAELSPVAGGKEKGSGIATSVRGRRRIAYTVRGRFVETLRVTKWLLILQVAIIVGMSVSVPGAPTSNIALKKVPPPVVFGAWCFDTRQTIRQSRSAADRGTGPDSRLNETGTHRPVRDPGEHHSIPGRRCSSVSQSARGNQTHPPSTSPTVAPEPCLRVMPSVG